MLRQDSGKMVHLNDGPEAAQKLGDTTHWRMFCHDCEQHLGEQFDRPMKEAFKNLRTAFNAGKLNIVFDHPCVIKRAIASVLWRSSISDAEFYSGFRIPTSLQRALLLEFQKSDKSSFSYRLSLISDPTPKFEGGFDNEVLDAFLLSPKLWTIKRGFRGRQKENLAMLFIAGGIVVEVTEKISRTAERKMAFLPDTKVTYPLKAINMWQIPALENLLIGSVTKHKNTAKSFDHSASSS